MQNLYPLFEQNRILKKELMWSLRDYSFTHIQLEYEAYADGILKGCEIEIQDKELVVGRGIVKYGGFIFLVTEKMKITYEPTERLQILKMKMEIDKRSEDFIAYRITLLLDDNPVKQQDELELCRFKLRSGSRLRNQYKDFWDMATDYDTVNLIEADWGGLSGKTLAPAITDYYANQLLKESGIQPEDISFAYLCLNQSAAISRKILEHYVSMKYKECDDGTTYSNQHLFDEFVQILDDIRNNRKSRAEQQVKRRQIMVD